MSILVQSIFQWWSHGLVDDRNILEYSPLNF